MPLVAPAACVALAAAVLVGYVGDATADPPGTSAHRQVLASARDALTQAELDLGRLEATAAQAEAAHQQAAARVTAAKQASVQAAAHAQVAKAAAAQAESNLGRLVAAVYRYGAAQDAGTLFLMLDVSDPMQYLEGVHTVRRVVVSSSSVLAQARTASHDADAASARASAQETALTEAEQNVGRTAKTASDAAQVAEARVTALGNALDALLGRQGAGQTTASELALEAAAEAEAAAEHPSPVSYDAAFEAKAVSYALAQLGKPYLWGGTGPDSFDCSGLAMRAYESAGTELPHFAAFQYAASRPLTYGQLRPGDLLFWASDPGESGTIYHEAIYLGGQQMVQAPKTGWDVMVSNMWMWGPIQFYARPGTAGR
ncbi:C40 family peptidase [Actinospica robiniae]|uniref:C40 family peptidase n=1 Tax=Actinospica robiniae TaxID=304901 RepID=UPI0003FE7584|nr:C40 family peptidase [Actinospica robiniae]